MATPIPLRMRWLKYILGLGLLMFLFNKIIVMQYMTDYVRARVMRFQLSCVLQCLYSAIASYVWWNLSPLLDLWPKEKRELTFANFFSIKAYKIESKLWKISLAFVLVSSSFIYPTFAFLISTEPYMISYWIGLCWGVKINLFTGVLIVNIVCFMIRICRRNVKLQSIRWKLQCLVILYTVFATVGGFYNATRSPTLQEVEIPVKQLPTELVGMTITFIPDIHLGPTTGKTHLEKIVHTVNYLQSDLVIIGGDLVDGRVDQLKESVEPLEWLSPKYGLYFVTGNHEYYTSDVQNWFAELESRGVIVLHNSHVWLPSQDDRGLCLAGVDDPQGEAIQYMDHKTDIDKALTLCGDSRPVILVSHRPDGAKAAFNSDHRVDLVLSGHTHGGQMFPITLGSYLLNPYYAGLYKHGESSHVYVSMGTRFWGFPIRVGTRSEITKITLVKEE